MNEATITGLFVSVFAFGTLLYLAALGEMIAEKSGVLNLGVEGMMAMGGMTAFWVGVRGLSLFDVQLVDPGNAWIALLVAGVVGAILASIHGVVSVVMGADQVVSGLALTIFGLGMAAFLGEALVIERPVAEFSPLDLGPLSSIRFLGPVIFEQPPIMWLAIGSGIATWLVLERTRVGLGVRAVGESAATADAAGQPVVKTRLAAVAIGGMFTGFAGASDPVPGQGLDRGNGGRPGLDRGGPGHLRCMESPPVRGRRVVVRRASRTGAPPPDLRCRDQPDPALHVALCPHHRGAGGAVDPVPQSTQRLPGRHRPSLPPRGTLSNSRVLAAPLPPLPALIADG